MNVKKNVFALILIAMESIATARSFVVVKAPQLPIEVGPEEIVKVPMVIRNLGEDIYWQDLEADGSPETTVQVELADKWLRLDSGKPSYPFDVDITRNDRGLVSTDVEGTLFVQSVEVSREQPIFPRGKDTEVILNITSRSSATEPRTFSYTMYFRFYDAQCAFKVAEKYSALSKHADCIVYSLPLTTQNVRLAPPEIISAEEDARGIPKRPPREFKMGPPIMPGFPYISPVGK